MIWRAAVLVLVLLTGWLGLQQLSGAPGTVTLRWWGYQLETTALVLSGAVLVLVLLGFGLGQLYSFILRLPRQWQAKKWLKQQAKADQVLLSQTASLLTGDSSKKRKNELKLLSGPIPDTARSLALRLQQAQLFEKEGNVPAAAELYSKLMAYESSKQAATLGLAALQAKSENWQQAGELAEAYLAKTPTSSKALDIQFKAHLNQGEWQAAWALLSTLRKHDVYEPETADLHTTALALQLADSAQLSLRQRKKYLTDAQKFLPDSWQLTQKLLTLETNKNAAGRRRIYARIWQQNGRLDVFKAWFYCLQQQRKEANLKQVLQLAKKAPNKAQGTLCEGWAMLELNNLPAARRSLQQAAEAAPNKLVYELLAQLVTASNPGPSNEREEYLQRALTAPAYQEPDSNFDLALALWRSHYVEKALQLTQGDE